MSPSDTPQLRFLVDTNVWLDAFIDRSRNHDTASTFLKDARLSNTPLFTAIEATKDVYYLVTLELKRMQRREVGKVTELFANAVREAAWSCVTAMRRNSTIVAADASDMVEAIALRADHDDYEDNLIIAAAIRANATHIISSDKQLQACSPIACIGLDEALELMGAPQSPSGTGSANISLAFR